jgi:hypothetical protein
MVIQQMAHDGKGPPMARQHQRIVPPAVTEPVVGIGIGSPGIGSAPRSSVCFAEPKSPRIGRDEEILVPPFLPPSLMYGEHARPYRSGKHEESQPALEAGAFHRWQTQPSSRSTVTALAYPADSQVGVALEYVATERNLPRVTVGGLPPAGSFRAAEVI